MTIGTRKTRSGESRLFIEIRYRTADGARKRFRRDAQTQTKYGARAEERRLLVELTETGTLGNRIEELPSSEEEEPDYTFADAVRNFRRLKLPTLKHSTGFSYNHRLNELLLPRFGSWPLVDVDGNALREMDAQLAGEKLSASTRRNMQIVVRSVLSFALETGNLQKKPQLPTLPKTGKKIISPIRQSDLTSILAAASPNARIAFMLAAYAGLRAGEVRGLQWSDIDLKGPTLTVRRAISRNKATTPKSGHQRLVPLTPSLVKLLSGIPKAGPWSPVALTVHGNIWGETGLNQAFKRARSAAGYSEWSFHHLRHFFCTELARRGAPAPAIQKLAGHADLSTTQRYIDMVATDMHAAISLFEGNDGATGTEGNLPTP